MTTTERPCRLSPTLRPTRRVLLGALAGLGFSSLPAFAGEARVVKRSAVAFGTTVTLTLLDDGAGAVEPALTDGFAAIRAIERAANLFDPSSEISRLNREGHVAEASNDFLRLVRFAKELAEASEGAFDPTVQPLWAAWAQAAARGERPTAEALAAARRHVDHRALVVDGRAVAFSQPGMGLTLNALAQGFAADRVVAAVAAHGIAHAFLDTGEIGALGNGPESRAWRVGIAHPRREGAHVGALDLGSRRFVATSADNRTFWLPDLTEHHIVDPKTGHSPGGLAEVAVIAASGLVADGLSTTLMVTDGHVTPKLLALDPSLGIVQVDKAGEVSSTGIGAEGVELVST